MTATATTPIHVQLVDDLPAWKAHHIVACLDHMKELGVRYDAIVERFTEAYERAAHEIMIGGNISGLPDDDAMAMVDALVWFIGDARRIVGDDTLYLGCLWAALFISGHMCLFDPYVRGFFDPYAYGTRSGIDTCLTGFDAYDHGASVDEVVAAYRDALDEIVSRESDLETSTN